jgi:hypothetical protein
LKANGKGVAVKTISKEQAEERLSKVHPALRDLVASDPVFWAADPIAALEELERREELALERRLNRR